LSFLRIFFSDFRTSAFTEEDNASGQQQQADDCGFPVLVRFRIVGSDYQAASRSSRF
jgi:hypothetical protein